MAYLITTQEINDRWKKKMNMDHNEKDHHTGRDLERDLVTNTQKD